MVQYLIVYTTDGPVRMPGPNRIGTGGTPLKALNVAALVLMVVGALNWGLWGFFQFDLVAALFGGNTSAPSRIVYSLVGLAGVIGLTLFGLLLGRTRERVAV